MPQSVASWEIVRQFQLPQNLIELMFNIVADKLLEDALWVGEHHPHSLTHSLSHSFIHTLTHTHTTHWMHSLAQTMTHANCWNESTHLWCPSYQKLNDTLTRDTGKKYLGLFVWCHEAQISKKRSRTPSACWWKHWSRLNSVAFWFARKNWLKHMSFN